MMDVRLVIVIVGVAIGSIVMVSMQAQAIPNSNIGIAPTDAMETIQVQTSPWYTSDTLVEADSYNQKIYFVSDGTIIFNVTEAFNSTHPVP